MVIEYPQGFESPNRSQAQTDSCLGLVCSAVAGMYFLPIGYTIERVSRRNIAVQD